MEKDTSKSRRKFLKNIGATGLAAAVTPLTSMAYREKAEERIMHYERKIAANDKIR